MRLDALADVIRSKNAGIHYVTVDVMFDDEETYAAVKDSGALSRELFAERYGLDVDDVRFFEYDAGLTFKITIPRLVPAGSPGDSDVFGAQQHAPVLDVEVPVDPDRDV